MKKQLLTLSFAFLGAGLIMAVAPNSATSPDSAKNSATINYFAAGATIDGVADDAVWAEIAAIPVDRPFIGETPSLYSATWKGFWNDTAVFILVESVDDSFWPSWKSGQADWASDKTETYFDVNGVIPSHLGPGGGGGINKGLYQITNNYDTVPAAGLVHNGSVDSTYQANTWSYGDHSAITVEWCVAFKALRDSNLTEFAPVEGTQIGFDICISDLDSGIAARQRQMWSNKGINGEDWNTMDSCGIVTFGPAIVAINQITSEDQALVYPTLVNDVLYVNSDQLSVYNTLGQLIMRKTNINGQIDVSTLPKGVYIATNGKVSQRFIKK